METDDFYEFYLKVDNILGDYKNGKCSAEDALKEISKNLP